MEIIYPQLSCRGCAYMAVYWHLPPGGAPLGSGARSRISATSSSVRPQLNPRRSYTPTTPIWCEFRRRCDPISKRAFSGAVRSSGTSSTTTTATTSIYPDPRSQRGVREATPVSPRCLRPSARPASTPPRPSTCQEGLLEPARDNRHPPCSLGWLEPACEQRKCQSSTEIPWSVDHMEEHPKS